MLLSQHEYITRNDATLKYHALPCQSSLARCMPWMPDWHLTHKRMPEHAIRPRRCTRTGPLQVAKSLHHSSATVQKYKAQPCICVVQSPIQVGRLLLSGQCRMPPEVPRQRRRPTPASHHALQAATPLSPTEQARLMQHTVTCLSTGACGAKIQAQAAAALYCAAWGVPDPIIL